MVQYDVLKGSTVVGRVAISDDAEEMQLHTLRIDSLVGARACREAKVNGSYLVDDYEIDWDRLDNDPVLDDQPWGLEPQ